MARILVMSEAWQSALACIQSLGQRGHEIHVVGASRPSIHARSSYVRGICRVASADPEVVLRQALAYADEQAVDVIIPVSDFDATLAARARETLPGGHRFLVGPQEAVAIARSRNRTIDLCRSLGIRTPRTLFATHETAREMAEELGFPCFLKISGTVASQGVLRLSSRADLRKALARVPAGTEMQLQEPIAGDFVDVAGFCRAGEVLASFGFRASYDMSMGGVPAHSLLVEDPRLDAILSGIAGALEWSGGLDVDLLATRDGDLAVLEINPRLSGTSVFALKRGLDLPAGYLPDSATASDLACPAERADADAFVSLPEEARFLMAGGAKAAARAIAFRREHRCTDNAFWIDQGYSKALFDLLQAIRLGVA